MFFGNLKVWSKTKIWLFTYWWHIYPLSVSHLPSKYPTNYGLDFSLIDGNLYVQISRSNNKYAVSSEWMVWIADLLVNFLHDRDHWPCQCSLVMPFQGQIWKLPYIWTIWPYSGRGFCRWQYCDPIPIATTVMWIRQHLGHSTFLDVVWGFTPNTQYTPNRPMYEIRANCAYKNTGILWVIVEFVYATSVTDSWHSVG